MNFRGKPLFQATKHTHQLNSEKWVQDTYLLLAELPDTYLYLVQQTAQAKAYKYPTSHSSPFNSCANVVCSLKKTLASEILMFCRNKKHSF